MCDLLGVDAILTSNFGLEKPMSTGGAIALAVLTGFGASTNKVTVTLGIKIVMINLYYGSMTDQIIGGIGSSPGTLVDGLMRQASKKMPYFNK